MQVVATATITASRTTRSVIMLGFIGSTFEGSRSPHEIHCCGREYDDPDRDDYHACFDFRVSQGVGNASRSTANSPWWTMPRRCGLAVSISIASSRYCLALSSIWFRRWRFSFRQLANELVALSDQGTAYGDHLAQPGLPGLPVCLGLRGVANEDDLAHHTAPIRIGSPASSQKSWAELPNPRHRRRWPRRILCATKAASTPHGSSTRHEAAMLVATKASRIGLDEASSSSGPGRRRPSISQCFPPSEKGPRLLGGGV
jgi:hypothetical protein